MTDTAHECLPTWWGSDDRELPADNPICQICGRPMPDYADRATDWLGDVRRYGIDIANRMHSR